MCECSDRNYIPPSGPTAAEAEHKRDIEKQLKAAGKCPQCFGSGFLINNSPYGQLSNTDCPACNGTGNSSKTGLTWQAKEAALREQELKVHDEEQRAWAAEHNRQYFESKEK